MLLYSKILSQFGTSKINFNTRKTYVFEISLVKDLTSPNILLGDLHLFIALDDKTSRDNLFLVRSAFKYTTYGKIVSVCRLSESKRSRSY